LLRISSHNLSGEQLQSLLNLMGGFEIPLQYQEENHAY